jgi:hypothetical protein
MGVMELKSMLRLKRIYLLVLIPVSLLLILLAKKSSFFAEQVFALHIYKWLSQIISMISGLIPISLAEVLVITFPLALVTAVLLFLIHILKKKGIRRQVFLKGLVNSICVASIGLFLFTILAGINYYRYPFSRYSGLTITDSSMEELYSLTESLAIQANELRNQTEDRDADGVFRLSESKYQLAKLADQAMEALARKYSVLDGYYSAPKPVLLSKLMSYTEITGIFFPFTMEANVNVDIPDYTIPATMLHELAHLRGFMREDEANFISYLAGMESESAELKYSSTMLALIISGNALYDQDPELYFKIRDQYSEGVLKDIRANSEYWIKYEDTVVSTVSNKINDTYLKANAQTDGVQSYGRMLDLLLAKYRKEQESVTK